MRDRKQDAVDEEALVARNNAEPDKAELRDVADQVGNQEMLRRLEVANQTRDELVGFTVNRLQISRGVQTREAQVARSRNSWYRTVARGYERAPDPRRWHRAARCYRKALMAACAGELVRAAFHIEAGMQAEHAAFDGLSDRVVGTLAKGHKPPNEKPAALARVSIFPTSTSCKLPVELDLADRIENMDPEIFRAMIRKGKRGPGPDDIWWNTDDDPATDDDAA